MGVNCIARELVLKYNITEMSIRNRCSLYKGAVNGGFIIAIIFDAISRRVEMSND